MKFRECNLIDCVGKIARLTAIDGEVIIAKTFDYMTAEDNEELDNGLVGASVSYRDEFGHGYEISEGDLAKIEVEDKN